jgi:3-phosphoshikimate 1-carboxyvinyltransferase
MTFETSHLITPAKNVLGSLRMPGDKSISHRYAMLAAIAEGKTRLENFSSGADCASTLSCLRSLGCEVSIKDGVVEIEGRPGSFVAPTQALNCGNSGSTMRMLSGILAAQEFDSELIGDESLMRRPMGRVVKPLSLMGAEIQTSKDGTPPIRIYGSNDGGLRGISYTTPTPSAQVKSAILFAGLLADGETQVEEAVRTRDHGELALRAFGAEVLRSRNLVRIKGGQKLTAIQAFIPGDISSAAFFLCAAAMFPGSNLVIEGLGMNPTRAALLDVLTALGARIGIINLEEHQGELVGTVKIESGELRGLKIHGAQASQLIDELPLLAAIAPFTREGIEIRDARELRVKESDRIVAVAANLRRMGAQVEEFEDGLRIPGSQILNGAELESMGDHRIAMAFAVTALRAKGESLIKGAEAVGVSFPEFWKMLDAVSER